MMAGFGGDLREVEAGTQRHRRTCVGKTYQGLTGTWVQSKGCKGGECTGTGRATDAGTRREAQTQAVEAVGWRLGGDTQVGSSSHQKRWWVAG